MHYFHFLTSVIPFNLVLEEVKWCDFGNLIQNYCICSRSPIPLSPTGKLSSDATDQSLGNDYTVVRCEVQVVHVLIGIDIRVSTLDDYNSY